MNVIVFQKKILGLSIFQEFRDPMLHSSQILDSGFWILDNVLEIISFIQHQVTSIQYQRVDAEEYSVEDIC